MEVVEYNDWLNALKQINLISENIDKYPGIKLVEFYEDTVGEPEGTPCYGSVGAQE